MDNFNLFYEIFMLWTHNTGCFTKMQNCFTLQLLHNSTCTTVIPRCLFFVGEYLTDLAKLWNKILPVLFFIMIAVVVL
jgi:hypothetical protein